MYHCLDVVNGNYSLGNNVQLWSRNGSGAQLFDIYKYDTGKYPLVENLGDDFYANIAAGNGRSSFLENNDGNVQICSIDNDSANPQQQWHFVRQADGSYRISNQFDGRYINADAMGGEGTNISVYSSLEWDAQKWYVVKRGDKYQIHAKYDMNLCLDVLNAGFTPGNNVQLWSKNGSDAQMFSISKNSSASTISVAYTALSGISNKVYTGKGLTQTPTVKLGEKILVKGTDYTVSCANNVNVGKATVIITGKGSYTGTKSATFKINPASIFGAEVSGLTAKTHTGKPLTQGLTVKLGGATLKAGTDYAVSYKNNVNVGTATATVTGKGNYAGSKSATFKIAKATVVAPNAKTGLVYNGKQQVGVAAGKGYSATGNKATGAGAHTATLTADANHVFAGGKRSVTVEWSIAKAQLAVPKAKAGLVYTGKKLTGVPAGKSFLVKGNTATNAGNYTATLTADGNHIFKSGKSTVKVGWKVAKAPQKISAKNASAIAKAKKSGGSRALAKSVTVNLKKKAEVSAKTTVKYAKANKVGGKKITVNKKTGKVTLKKGLKAGTYKVKVKLTAPAGKNYKAAKAKTVTLTVKVK